MKIAGRIVSMFRTMYDPMIGPKPLNAFVPDSMGAKAVISEEGTAVIMTLSNGNQHVVPFTNVQSIRLAPEELQKPITADISVIKRGPGRWPKKEDHQPDDAA